MVIKRRYRNFRRQQELNIKRLRRNAGIRVPEVRLVDESDQNIGVVPIEEALRRAGQAELDLVEVSPKANPPVCRIMDYGQYEYRQEKLARKAKASQKKIDLKGIRITFRMGDHDKETRASQAQKFLTKGNKVKIEMHLRGREKAHQDLARALILDFAKTIGIDYTIEEPIKKLGGRLSMVISPKASTSYETQNS